MPFEWELQHLLSTAPSDGHFQPGATGPRDVRKGTRDRHGLLDLRGNVWEWCLDAWSERPPTRLTGAAIEAHLDESESARRVVRGGGWDVEATLCLARVWADAASAGIGLRLVADAGDGAPGWIPDELAEARRWVGQLNPANRHACLRAGGVLGADDIDRYQGGVNAIRAYLATHHPAVLRR